MGNQAEDIENGYRHVWLWNSETGSEAGLGPQPGGWGGIFGFFSATSINDHRGAHNERSWKDVACVPQPSADEACVEGFINESNFGQSLGPWFPYINDCRTFADEVLMQCGGFGGGYSSFAPGFYPYYPYY